MSPERIPGDFGSSLRLARERRGISLREIATRTKISIAALEALERNDIGKLPGGIFSRAFVRSYALEVGLDPEQMIQEFLAQFPQDTVTAGHPVAAPVEDHDAVESERRMASTFLGLLAISIPLAGAVLYFGTVGRPKPPVNTDVATPSLSPPAPVTPAAPASTAAPPPIATPSPEAPPPAPPARQARPSALTTTESATAPRSAIAPTSTEQLPAAAPVASKPAPSSDSAADSHFTVVITVTRPCYVTATVDGERTIDRLLQPGEQSTIDVRREMVLTAGDAGAIAMTINGAEARPLGKAGDVVTARLTIANFKGFLASQ